uniref:MADS-box domain-containing protein n=1 Tax=Ascaris lumbricoides TaxID=6252 RepID=A0A0M3IP43_ASCLU
MSTSTDRLGLLQAAHLTEEMMRKRRYEYNKKAIDAQQMETLCDNKHAILFTARSSRRGYVWHCYGYALICSR